MKYFFLLLMISSFAWADNVRPFKTDFCTNFPEGTKEEPALWKHCCLTHDMFFWAGGSKRDRDVADLDLKSCIAKTGATQIAELMYLGVRAGSLSPIKYPDKKWNNGWRDRPDFQGLTSGDITQIETEIYNGYDYISQNIKNYFIHQLRSRLE
ncbi:hypothetical protein ACJVC5_02590 [Peredibacter sp. HCB2-198]|uniref:hypothetical protein n=1 Tax=Peredibacter sp. HCB2-198 TaxID=3383025 RepID=UPI0038B4A608